MNTPNKQKNPPKPSKHLGEIKIIREVYQKIRNGGLLDEAKIKELAGEALKC